MTTTTITEYAVQVVWPDDRWTFVVNRDSPDEPQVFTEEDAAREMASIWRPGSARVVTRTRTETSWEVVE